jgi:hypothetical protein
VLSGNPKLKIYFPPDPFWGAELPFDITGRDAEAKKDLPAEHLKRPVGLVMGGFHLLPYKEKEIRGIAEQMRDEFGVKRVAPAHCTGHLGLRVFLRVFRKVFGEVFGEQYQLAGLGSVVRIAAAADRSS